MFAFALFRFVSPLSLGILETRGNTVAVDASSDMPRYRNTDTVINPSFYDDSYLTYTVK